MTCDMSPVLYPCKKISGIPGGIGGIPGRRLGIPGGVGRIPGGRLGIPGGMGRIPGRTPAIPGAMHQPRWSAPDSL